MLEDGEILIDSTAILDYLNELTPDAPLIPSASKPRRQAQKLAAIGLGMFEQTTKLSFRGADLTPAEAERWWGQIRGGLEALDAAAGEAGPLWVTPIDVAVITVFLLVVVVIAVKAISGRGTPLLQRRALGLPRAKPRLASGRWFKDEERGSIW